jgi:hypothetical protein
MSEFIINRFLDYTDVIHNECSCYQNRHCRANERKLIKLRSKLDNQKINLYICKEYLHDCIIRPYPDDRYISTSVVKEYISPIIKRLYEYMYPNLLSDYRVSLSRELMAQSVGVTLCQRPWVYCRISLENAINYILQDPKDVEYYVYQYLINKVKLEIDSWYEKNYTAKKYEKFRRIIGKRRLSESYYSKEQTILNMLIEIMNEK